MESTQHPDVKKTIVKGLANTATLLCVITVAACGGSSSSESNGVFPSSVIDSGPESIILTGLNGANPDDVTSPWLVNTTTFRLNSSISDTGDGYVGLVRYSDNFPISRHLEFYERELDTCEVNDPDLPPTPGDGGDGGNPPPLISGGESVAYNTPSGPWFTFDREIVDGEPTYTTNNGLPGELLPQGATLSIPGDEFPTVTAHPMYGPSAPPARLLPDETIPVTANSVYTWIPGENKTYMQLSLLAFDSNDQFIDFVVGCDLRDDGAFTMPVDVIDFVSTTPYRLQARYTRYYQRIDLANGIVIRQRHGIAE